MESPGTAPGSDPSITCAFITIVPKRNTLYIGALIAIEKGGQEMAQIFWQASVTRDSISRDRPASGPDVILSQ